MQLLGSYADKWKLEWKCADRLLTHSACNDMDDGVGICANSVLRKELLSYRYRPRARRAMAGLHKATNIIHCCPQLSLGFRLPLV